MTCILNLSETPVGDEPGLGGEGDSSQWHRRAAAAAAAARWPSDSTHSYETPTPGARKEEEEKKSVCKQSTATGTKAAVHKNKERRTWLTEAVEKRPRRRDWVANHEAAD